MAKSQFHILLLLAAGVLVATAGAAAAEDAVVDPDPGSQQTANICDAYGRGYVQVPGTQTCIRASGEARYEQGFSKSARDRN